MPTDIANLLRNSRAGALLLISLLLGACASDGNGIARYMLPRADAPMTSAPLNRAALRVEPPQLSALIDRRGLLMQTSDIELHEAQHHQWAEELAPQLHLALKHALADTLQHWRISPAGGEQARLRLRLDQFQGRHDGVAVISGEWQLQDAGGHSLHSQSFWYAEPLAQDGYPALVRSLDRAWLKLAGEIATQIDKPLAAKP